MNAADLGVALSEATDVPHAAEDLGPGVSQLTPVGFQPGDAAYFIRVEHAGLRYAVTVSAAPFSGRIVSAVLERLQQYPELGDSLVNDLSTLGWVTKRSPLAGSPVLFDAREGNAAIGGADEPRQRQLLSVLVQLTTFMLGVLAVTRVPMHTRPARRRDQSIAENLSWEYNPAERDRATATHRRLENWLIDRLEGEGIRPLDPDGAIEFDLAWLEHDSSLSVCEVKSTSGHEDGQIRLGLGQVLHYAARLRAEWSRSINPVLFIEGPPTDPVWLPLGEEHGVVIAWPESWDGIRMSSPDPENYLGREPE